MKRSMIAVVAAVAGMVLALGVSAQAAPLPVWHSYDATIRTTSTNLIRGDIVDANTSIPAELKFYTSADVLGVAEAATVTVGGTGLYSTGTHGAYTDDGLDLDTSNYWALPGGDGLLADDLTQADWFTPFVGFQLSARPDDGSHGDLPGGSGTAGEHDLSFHSPSTWSEGVANEYWFQNHLGVIAFIAPQDGEYEITNFGARAMQDILGSQSGECPDDRSLQSVHIIDDNTGSTVVLDSIICGGIIGSNRDLTWKISPNTTSIYLEAGQDIHFAAHCTELFEEVADGPGQEFFFDATNVAFDITLIPEPATLSLMGLGGVLTFLRRRRK